MEALNIAEAKNTPSIVFDLKNGNLEIKGKSIPENAPDFYQPLMEAIQVYSEALQAITTLNFSLLFFNTSSSKYLLKILTAFATLNKRGTKVVINWYHDPDDEDMLETANDIENSCGLEFKYHAKDMGSYQ